MQVYSNKQYSMHVYYRLLSRHPVWGEGNSRR